MSATMLHPDAGCRVPASSAGVRVELLARGDEATVQKVFDGLRPRSRALRFLTAKPRLTRADLRQLTDVDGHDRVAVVARHDGHAIGIARFVRDLEDPASAEAAVAVVDAWQDRSVGTRLAHALLGHALDVGVRRFSVAMAHDNEAAARLMHGITDDVTRVGWQHGTVDFEIHLAPVRPIPRSVLKGVGRRSG
jgi:GNAT superfamily N-acetyltransferase